MIYPEIAFKRILDRNDGGTWGDDPVGSGDTVVLRSTEQTVDGNWSIDAPAFRAIAPNDALRFRLQEDDLLLTKSSGSALHIGKATIVDAQIANMNAVYSNFMQRIRLSRDNHARFYWYVLRTSRTRDQWTLTSTTTTGLANLNATTISGLLVPQVPLDEQRQIAEYLDRETGKIDELIAKQEQLVDRVAERRQTVITETVLRGLDSSAELKASGMDAIGSIPGHWTVSPLKHAISAIEQGVSPEASAELADSESWGVLKSGCVNGGKFSDVEHKRLPDDFDFLPSLAVAVGDLLISRASGSPSLVGSAAIVKHLRYRLILSDKTFRLRAKVGVDVRFIEQFMQSKAYREQVRGAISGAVGLANNLPMSSLKSFQIAIPPLTEQIKIADFLDQKVGQIDLLVAKAKEVTRAISERRAALISAAVTGKIDVRGL